MHLRTLFAAFLLAGAFASSAEARLFQEPTPDELARRAPIICTGHVISLTNTLVKGTRDWPGGGGNPGVPVEYWIAKIYVLNVTKGKLPETIELRFPRIDQHPTNRIGIMDGPIQIYLTAGQNYRFYLKPVPGKSWHVGVLDGEFDDGFAVEPLSPH